MKKVICVVVAFLLAFGVLFSAAAPVKASETCIITFDANGGNESTSEQYLDSGVEGELSKSAAHRFGYNFVGWSESSTATTASYMPGDKITVNKDITLYAVWKAAETITPGADTITATAAGTDKNFVYYKVVPSKTAVYGFCSIGENDTYISLCSEDGTELNCSDDDGEGANFLLTEELTKGETYYIAVNNLDTDRTDPVNFVFDECYKVTYDCKGGDFAVENDFAIAGQNVQIRSDVPRKSGHIFMGWSKTSDGTEVDYLSGATLTPTGDITLYAVWQAGDYTIKYDLNGGNGSFYEQGKMNDKDINLSGEMPRRFAYTFKGWSTSASSSVVSYLPGDKYTANADLTLYAVWEEAASLNSVTNSGTCTITPPMAYGGVYVKFTVSESGLYSIFSKGTAQTDENCIIYDEAGDELDNNDDYGDTRSFRIDMELEKGKTYYAYVESINTNTETITLNITKAYTISYNLNGGEGEIEAHNVRYNAGDTLTDEVPLRDGYYFVGWSTTANGAVEYGTGGAYNANKDAVLYAVWSNSSYTVTYNTDGAEESIDEQIVGSGAKIKLSGVRPSRFGYYFDGWATSPTAAVAEYQPQQSITVSEDTTLYAVWIEAAVIAGSEREEIDDALSGDYVIFKPTQTGLYRIYGTAVKDNCVYVYTEDGEELTYNDEGEGFENNQFAADCGLKKDEKYYIKVCYFEETNEQLPFVIARLYTITYNMNYDGGTIEREYKSHGTATEIFYEVPEREGFTFMGWGASSTATKAVCENGEAYSQNSDLTLYAIWKSDLAITKQPENVCVAKGELAEVTVEAQGDGLTYQWWIKNEGDTVYTKSSITSNTYSAVMNEERDGRILRCVIKDKYGDLVRSDIVTITMKVPTELKITKQPVSAEALNGELVSVSVEAQGDGLTYQWWIKNEGDTVYTKSSITSDTYSAVMNETRDGRILRCVIKDQYGNLVRSDIVTITMKAPTELKITQQPVSASAASGELVSVTVKAQGDGVTYQWWIKNPGDSAYTKSSITSSTYTTNMTAVKDGRILRCVIKDQYGNLVRSDIVTISMKATELKITQQPVSASAASGEYVSVTVKAQGDGVTYQWWIKNPGDSAYTKSSITSNTYTTNMTAAKDGRILRCVIKDKYGNLVRSDIVTISMS